MISVEHLTKFYGPTPAVEDLSFQIEEGQVYGFLGPNGAGKSTAMNIMTGCLSPTSGKVTICGYDILEEPEKAKKCIGYLPEQPPLYMNETPEEYLRFVGEAKKVKREVLDDQIREVMASTGISDVSHRRIGDLSKGYRQRLGIAQALLGNPQVVILDEPTVGLDPLQITQIRELIRSLGDKHTVILSSHILSEVQAICQKILIISGGKLVAFDTPEGLEARFAGDGSIRFTVEATKTETEAIVNRLDSISGYTAKAGDGVTYVTVAGNDSKEAARVLSLAFAKEGKAILEMNVRRASLEDVFLELTEKAGGKEEAES